MKDNNQRLLSLDTLRGFDMLFIMGFAGLVMAICTLFPNGSECWLHKTMEHAQWNGLYHHDTIFPLFLFIAGISFPFSYAKQLESGVSRRHIYIRIFKRALTLVLLGIVYEIYKIEKVDLFKCVDLVETAKLSTDVLYKIREVLITEKLEKCYKNRNK